MQKTCEICQKTMIGDTVKIHIKSHEKMNSLDETHRSGASGEVNNLDETHRREKTVGDMERNLRKMYKCWSCTLVTNWLRKHEKFMHYPTDIKQIYKCRDCTYSTKRSNNLKRHEKAMHNPSFTEYHCTIDVDALKNEIVQADKEYKKKLELGREIRNIVEKLNIRMKSLDKEKMDAII